MSRLPTITALSLLLGLCGCAQPPQPVALGPGPSPAYPIIGFNNQLVTGNSPGGTWDTAGGMQSFQPPNSLPAGAEGQGRRVTPAFP